MSKKNKSKVSIEGLSLDDPLDMNATLPNFLNNEPYSAEYIELAKAWSSLPLYINKDQIFNFFNSIENNQVTLVISGTGSGKTVLIPKFLLKYFMLNNKKTENNFTGKIVVTNPKVLTTIYNADYSAKTLDVLLGSYVGYKFRGAPENMSSDKTKLLYSTDGLLLAQILKGDTLLSEYQGVIIDEAHERQVPIDLLLYFLKNIVKERPEFKVIIMSATIDPEIFKNFYEKDGITFGKVEISGKSNYPIESIYMQPNDKINTFNFLDIGISIILDLLEKTDSGDILMFVTTQRETEIGCSKLKMLCPKQMKITDVCDSYYCAEVYGKMTDDNRELAVDKDKYKSLSSKYKRKIIFATNVAESSITLDGIIYVLDSGLELLSYFNYQKNMTILDKKFTTKAQVKQRMGRAGRTQPGVCYHLYTEKKFSEFDDFPKPNIALANLNDHILSFIKYKLYLSDAINLAKSLITPVSPWQLISSLRFLHFNNLIKIVDLEISGGSLNNKRKVIINKSNRNIIKSSINHFLELNGGSEDSAIIYDSESDSELESESEKSIYEKTENEMTQTHVPFKLIPWKQMLDYNKWDKYQGCLSRLGKIINDLSGYPLELSLLAFYGRLLSLPMIYSMVSIIAAMDYKIDNLIKFPPNTMPQDKIQFINSNFPDAVTYYYSEHLFVYNILTNYYEMQNKLELLNLPVFEKANEIKKTFSKVLDRIKDKDLDDINLKYKLIPDTIKLDDMDMMHKIYLSICLAYKYNVLRLIDKQNKPIYQTQYYIENTSGQISFNFGKQLDSNDADNYSWGICSGISNVTGKVYINGITLFPNDFSNLYMNNLIN